MRTNEKEIRRVTNMKRCLGFTIILLLLGTPALLAQDDQNHIEIGAFADYFRLNLSLIHI